MPFLPHTRHRYLSLSSRLHLSIPSSSHIILTASPPCRNNGPILMQQYHRATEPHYFLTFGQPKYCTTPARSKHSPILSLAFASSHCNVCGVAAGEVGPTGVAACWWPKFIHSEGLAFALVRQLWQYWCCCAVGGNILVLMSLFR